MQINKMNMKTRYTYLQPEIEIVEVEIEEGIMAGSIKDNPAIGEGTLGNGDYGRANRRNFWGNE